MRCIFLNFTGFLILIYFGIPESHTTPVECISVQLNDSAQVNCTATLYQNEDCNETRLSERYENLYGEGLYPGRPDNVALRPIQELYPGYETHGYYPGFHATFWPPRTADFQYVRGFQIDVQDNGGTNRCIIVQIVNKTLSSVHKINKVGFKVKLWALPQVEADYNFTAYSLPTPKDDEKEVLLRYGKTTNKWEPNTPSSWRTTITYYVNKKDKFIQFWFVPAPDEFHFLYYEITLSRILANESTSVEVRNLTCCNPPLLINMTEYMFENVDPGLYRVGVQPYDDKAGSLNDYKCRDKYGARESCKKTVTAIIDIPIDDAGSAFPTLTTPSATPDPATQAPTTPKVTTVMFTALPTREGETDSAVLPSVLGILAFFLIVVLVVVCCKINRDRFKGMLDPKRATFSSPLNNAYVITPQKSVPLGAPKDTDGFQPYTPLITEKTVAIIAADDDENHKKVVSSFARYLQKCCHCNVQYYPWNPNDDKFRWISNTLERAHFHVFVASELAYNQYQAWKNKKLLESKDLFIPYLTKFVNRFDFSKKFVFVRFDYSSDILMPEDVCSNQYQLMKQFTEFLSHVHGLNPYKDDLKSVALPFDQDLAKTKEGRELYNAIHVAVKTFRPKHLRLDSGYKSQNECNSFDEKEWREVRQKYIIDHIVQGQPREEVFGVFLIDEESRSLMPGQSTERASIAPAITIAEGGPGEFRIKSELNSRNSGNQALRHPLHAVNKYGGQIEPNIQPNTCLNAHPSFWPGSENNTDENGNQLQGSSPGLFTAGPDESFSFLPPDPSILDEDITTQYQLELIDDINLTYLRSTRNEDDTISGHSV